MDEVLTEATPAALVHAVEAHQRETSVRWTSVQGGVVEELPDLVRYAAGHREAFTNGAQAARLAPERADEAIRDTIAFFDRHRVAALWWVGPLSEPGDLGDRLLRHGFRLDERMPWLAAVVPDAPAVDAPSELRIERVSDDRLQAAWLEAM